MRMNKWRPAEVRRGRESEPGLQPQPFWPVARIYSMSVGLKGSNQKDIRKHPEEIRMGGFDGKEGILKL